VIESSLTFVTGYWSVNNKHGRDYTGWFYNTLNINHPFVFYTSEYDIEFVKKYRKNLPTEFRIKEINEFETYQFNGQIDIHPNHMPSVELGLIWHEKIFLLKQALKENVFNSDWFFWFDAGHCVLRNKKSKRPLQVSLEKLNNLPIDKFCFSTSMTKELRRHRCGKNSYYHYLAGASFFVHKSMINKFADLYLQYLEELLVFDNVWTDQVIWTHILEEHPHLFFKINDGYGRNLYTILGNG
jgi:hypothetical protein